MSFDCVSALFRKTNKITAQLFLFPINLPTLLISWRHPSAGTRKRNWNIGNKIIQLTTAPLTTIVSSSTEKQDYQSIPHMSRSEFEQLSISFPSKWFRALLKQMTLENRWNVWTRALQTKIRKPCWVFLVPSVPSENVSAQIKFPCWVSLQQRLLSQDAFIQSLPGCRELNKNLFVT